MKSIWRYIGNAYRGLPLNMWLLSSVTLVNRSGTMVLVFMSLYLTRELHFSVSFAGLVLSCFGVGSLAGAFLGGRLTDRIGSFRVMTYSMFGGGICLLTLEHLRHPAALMVGMFLFGVIGESYRPASSSAVARICPPEQRTRGFALDRLAINVGATLGPAVGGLLALTDYAWLFRVDGLTCIAAGCMIRFLIARRAKLAPRPPAGATASADRAPWHDPLFLLFLLCALLSCLSFFQVFSTYPLFLKEIYGIGEFQLGLLLAVNGFMIITCEMILVHSLERFNPLKVMIAGACCLSLGFGILPAGAGIGLAFFSVVAWTCGEMLIDPFMVSFAANRASDRHRGSYMGLYGMTFALGLVVAPAMGTFVYDTFGPRVLWHLIACQALLMAVTLLFLNRAAAAEKARGTG